MEPDFVEEIDCNSLFDQIDDLIKFPSDGDSGGYFSGSGDSNNVLSNWNDSLPNSGNLFSGDLVTELSVPYEDIVHLEWLSAFVEDSFSTAKDLSLEQFQTSSPVSVLECISVQKTSPNHNGTQRARSKRPRPTTFNPRAGIQLIETPRSFVMGTDNSPKLLNGVQVLWVSKHFVMPVEFGINRAGYSRNIALLRVLHLSQLILVGVVVLP